MRLTDALSETKAFLTEPFTTPLSISQVFAIVGLVIVSIIAWNLVLFHIRIAAEEIV